MKGLLQYAILMVLLLTGCNENSPIRFGQNSAAGASRAETEILAMNPRELDICRFRSEGRGPLDSFSPSSGSSSRSSGSSQQADADAWQSALNVQNQLFGDDDVQEDDASTFSSSGGGGFSDQREGIAGIDNIQRDPSTYAVQVSSSSSNLATLYAQGVARVTTNIPGGNSPQIDVKDNATVSLVYNLSKVRDRWQCTSFTGNILEVRGQGATDPSPSDDNDGRIGW